MYKSVLLVGVLGITACAKLSNAETNTPRIVANSLTPTALIGSLLTTSVLNSTSAATMGPYKSARSMLSFAVGCALDWTQSVSFTVSGTTYTYAGLLGVAPGWTTSGLSATEAGWVSACILARVNLTSAVVEISARGGNVGYDTDLYEVSDYQIEEGAFWGNAFVDLGSLAAYSCNGVDQAADDTYGDLPLRECAEWDGVASSNRSPCGLSYAGLCSTACSSSTAPYTGCSFQGGTAASAVVTSFLYGAPQ